MFPAPARSSALHSPWMLPSVALKRSSSSSMGRPVKATGFASGVMPRTTSMRGENQEGRGEGGKGVVVYDQKKDFLNEMNSVLPPLVHIQAITYYPHP